MDYAGRRARLMQRIGDAAAVVVPAAAQLRAGADGELRYQPDSDLYYLTGYTEPEAVLVLSPGAQPAYALFVRPRDAERERWTGVRGGVAAATSQYGADVAYDVADLATRLPGLVAGASVLYAPPATGRPEVDAALRLALAGARTTRSRTGRGPHTVTDLSVATGPLRVQKDDDEITCMRSAAAITVAAFDDALGRVRGSDGEWQVEAALEHGFRRRGADGPAFPSIVAGGANATVLHYTANASPLRAGDLLLMDAGARHHRYCADVTRTVPVDGRFTAGQRAVYDIVLAARDAGVAAIRPGASADAVHDAALPVLIDGMKDIGLLSGTMDEILERGSYRRWFPHRTSHWLGLDVHDVGDYIVGGSPVALASGMVLTVEPGLYIAAHDDSAPPALRGLGVRLEDDVLVTADGLEVLTGELPIRPDEIEDRVGQA